MVLRDHLRLPDSIANELCHGIGGEAGDLFRRDGFPIVDMERVSARQNLSRRPRLVGSRNRRRHERNPGPAQGRDARLERAKGAIAAARPFREDQNQLSGPESTQRFLHAGDAAALTLDRVPSHGTDQWPEQWCEEARTRHVVQRPRRPQAQHEDVEMTLVIRDDQSATGSRQVLSSRGSNPSAKRTVQQGRDPDRLIPGQCPSRAFPIREFPAPPGVGRPGIHRDGFRRCGPAHGRVLVQRRGRSSGESRAQCRCSTTERDQGTRTVSAP